MSLMKSGSKKAFSANVAKERAAGKPLNQALAIAYDVKRRSGAETVGEYTRGLKRRKHG